MPASKKQNHEYRDEEFLNEKFGSVIGWRCPTDMVRFIEAANCWKSTKLYILDHMVGDEPRYVSSWRADAVVTWSPDAQDASTYVSGVPVWETEADLVQAIYGGSGMVSGDVPEKPTSITDSIQYIRDRKRNHWDHKAYCIDVDAWSETSTGPIIWDMKYIVSPGYSATADRILEMLGEQRCIPAYKVWYSKAAGSFGGVTSNKGDFVNICYGNSESKIYLAEELHDLTYAEAVEMMNRIVEKYQHACKPF